jgi:DNA mismatch repair protein MutS2
VRDKERTAERDARRAARRLLLDARSEVDRTIQELKASAAEAADETAREARRRMERLASEAGQAVAALDEPDVNDTQSPRSLDGNVSEGDFVSVPALEGRRARVMEIRGDDAIIVAGSVKMTVPRRSLGRVEAPENAGKVHINIRGDAPEVEAKSEIDIRGFRAGEIEDLLMHAVDSAVRADLKTLRIIHGKGTGALRERVSEMLSKESRVTSFRLGAWNEGGAGVTVAELT